MDDFLFKCQFLDAYSFRNIIAILRELFMNITPTISPSGIRIVQSNSSGSLLAKVDFPSSKLLEYVYNVTDADDGVVPEFSPTLTSIDFFKAIKSGNKKDCIIMYIYPNQPDLVIKVISGSSKLSDKESCFFVPILDTIELYSYEESEYLGCTPNVKIQASEFSKMCTQLSAIKCTNLQLAIFKKGLRCRGLLPGGRVGTITIWGSEDTQTTLVPQEGGKMLVQVTKVPITEITVGREFIKAFSKVCNLCNNYGILDFFAEKGKPVSIFCPIGTYGTFSVDLRQAEGK